MPRTKSNQKSDLGDVRRKQEYLAYITWSSLPSTIRGVDPDSVDKDKIPFRRKLRALGFDDPFIIELLTIKNQTEFAEKFDVSQETLSAWNRRMDIEGALDPIKVWARRLTKNVIYSLYQNALKHGDASRVQLWLEAMEEWERKSVVELGLSREDIERGDKIIMEALKPIEKNDQKADSGNGGGGGEKVPPQKVQPAGK